MPAGRAYAFLYHRCTSRLTEEGKLKVDAVLGDEKAKRELDSRRLKTAAISDWDVG